MPIIKTLTKATKLEKEKFTIPKSVQDAIPIQRVWPDGIFQVGSRFSKTFSFTDINYSVASKEDKTAMFLDYSELLNSLDSGASAKITINNRKVNKEEFEKSLLLPMREDGLDHYRKEYNEMLLSKVTGTNNSVVQDRYITITVAKKTIDEARTYFARVGTDLITHLSQLSSIGRELCSRPASDLPGFLQGERTRRLCLRLEGVHEEGAQLQGLALSRFDGIPKRPFPLKRPLGSSFVFTGLRQLHQGFHDCRTLRHGPQPDAFH